MGLIEQLTNRATPINKTQCDVSPNSVCYLLEDVKSVCHIFEILRKYIFITKIHNIF